MANTQLSLLSISGPNIQEMLETYRGHMWISPLSASQAGMEAIIE